MTVLKKTIFMVTRPCHFVKSMLLGDKNSTKLKKFIRFIFFAILIFIVIQLLWNIGIYACRLGEPSVGSIRYIVGEKYAVKIERLPDPPYQDLTFFDVSPDRKRYGYISYNYSSYRNLFHLPMDWSIIVDGKIVYQCKMPIKHLLIGRMTIPHAFLSFSFDSNHYAFKVNDQAYFDGKPITLPDCDKVVDAMFLPNDKILYRITKDEEEFLRLDDTQFLLPKTEHPTDFQSRFIAVSETGDSVVYFIDYPSNHDEAKIYFNGNIIQNVTEKSWPNLFGENNTQIYCFKEGPRQRYLPPSSDYKTRRQEHGFYLCEVLKKETSHHASNDNFSQYVPQEKITANNRIDVDCPIFVYKKSIWNKLFERQEFKIAIDDKQSQWFLIPKGNGNSFADGSQDGNQATLFATRYGCLYRIDIQRNHP